MSISLRLLTLGATALILTVLSACLVASYSRSPPIFVVARTGHSIMPVDYPFLQAWGDRLRGRRYLTLTFDDGPYGERVDSQILDILRAHGAKAIFFVVCSNLAAADDALFRRELEQGNEIGNHSFDHSHLIGLDRHALMHEIADCRDLIERRVGRRPVFFRPPFGQTSGEVRTVEHSLGLQEVLWNANSQDSWQTRPDQILDWSERETDNFSILLMHSKPATAAALDRVLSALQRRGFWFVLPVVDPSAPSLKESK